MRVKGENDPDVVPEEETPLSIFLGGRQADELLNGPRELRVLRLQDKDNSEK